MSDTHLFADPSGRFDGVETLCSLREVVALACASEEGVAAWVLTGDLAHEGEAGAYAWLAEVLGRVGAPVYCIPGNHDDPEAMRTGLAASRLRLGDSVDLGAWRLVLLDTRVAGEQGGRLGTAGLAMLEARLAERPEAYAVVCLHHPPVPVGSPLMDAMGLEDAEAFFAVLGRFPAVRAVLFGHVHQAVETLRDGVTLLGAPSTCVQFKPGMKTYERDDLPAGYRWLELFPDGSVRSGVRRLRGGRRAPSHGPLGGLAAPRPGRPHWGGSATWSRR